LDPLTRFLWLSVASTVLLGGIAFAVIALRRIAPAARFGLTLVAAGGFSNLVDRARFGSVTDFLALGTGPLRSGIFNVADVAILAGVLLCCGALAVSSWRDLARLPPMSN
jgi:signal peptidase II